MAGLVRPGSHLTHQPRNRCSLVLSDRSTEKFFHQMISENRYRPGVLARIVNQAKLAVSTSDVSFKLVTEFYDNS